MTSINLPNILKFVMYFAGKNEGFFKIQAGDVAITRCHHPIVIFEFSVFARMRPEIWGVKVRTHLHTPNFGVFPVTKDYPLNQAKLRRLGNRLGAIADLQLFKNVPDVSFDSIL